MDELIEPRDIVWAKLQGFPWWPGFVESVEPGQSYNVVFFGDQSHARLPAAKVRLWTRPPNLAKQTARHSRLRQAIAVARECVEQSVREQSAAAAEPSFAESPPSPRKDSLLTAADCLEAYRQAIEESLPIEESEPPLPESQTQLEERFLAAAERFCDSDDWEARSLAEGCLDRLSADFLSQNAPNRDFCARLARLYVSRAGDGRGGAFLRGALSRVLGSIWLRCFGGEERAQSGASTTFGSASPRQSLRVARKIAKAVARLSDARRPPKRVCEEFAERLERSLADVHRTPNEYRAAVLSFLEHVGREPLCEIRAQCERFPELAKSHFLREYVRL